MPADLPAEAKLLALAERWARAEARVRTLLAQAARGGDRRALLVEALALLRELRADALRAGPEVERAYAVALGAAALLLGRPDVVPARETGQRLGRALAGRLDKAAQAAGEGSREAFRAVTEENLGERAQDAVTGVTARDGARLAIGAYAAGVARQAARVAVSTGTAAALGDGLVRISSHGTRNPICIPLEGIVLPASGNLPPYHAGCQHVATPAGFTEGEHVEAMRAAVREAT
jgi:hypothetical protein